MVGADDHGNILHQLADRRGRHYKLKSSLAAGLISMSGVAILVPMGRVEPSAPRPGLAESADSIVWHINDEVIFIDRDDRSSSSHCPT
jgi:hypothetical protein